MEVVPSSHRHCHEWAVVASPKNHEEVLHGSAQHRWQGDTGNEEAFPPPQNRHGHCRECREKRFRNRRDTDEEARSSLHPRHVGEESQRQGVPLFLISFGLSTTQNMEFFSTVFVTVIVLLCKHSKLRGTTTNYLASQQQLSDNRATTSSSD